ncbi:MAG TPA: hypothetical protein VHO43_17955 [Ignavibacteriales bacterium]|nr:hypothetical protein [Ignavibacteriales bacterium]
MNSYYNVERYSMTIGKDSSFVIFKTEDYGSDQEPFSIIRGTYSISRDTMIISIEKYEDRVEKYLFKLEKDHLSFVLISEPFPDINDYPSFGRVKKQTLEQSWKRY